MQDWPDRRLLELLKVEIPIIQAPMAGSDTVALARAVASAGGLGSLACALLGPDAIRESVHAFRAQNSRPINLNFFCHHMAAPDEAAMRKWREFLRPHYQQYGLDIEQTPA
ncbi:MAG: nitronate monooxygenase, partial [Paludibaculum sp.]